MNNLDHLFRYVKQVLTQALTEERGRPRQRKKGDNPSMTKPQPKRL